MRRKQGLAAAHRCVPAALVGGVYPLMSVTEQPDGQGEDGRESDDAGEVLPPLVAHAPHERLAVGHDQDQRGEHGATKIVSAWAMTMSWIGDAWKISVTRMPKARMLPLTTLAVSELDDASSAESVGEHRAAGGRVRDHRRERGAEEPEREDRRSDRSGEGLEDAGEGDDGRCGFAGLAEHGGGDDDHERGHDARAR